MNDFSKRKNIRTEIHENDLFKLKKQKNVGIRAYFITTKNNQTILFQKLEINFSSLKIDFTFFFLLYIIFNYKLYPR